MVPESVISKGISLKDSLNKALLEKTPLVGVFVKCIDTHSELSLDQRRQWLTFTTSEYAPPRQSIKKPKGDSYSAEILDITEREVKEHMKFFDDYTSYGALWENLKREIDEETKKNPDLFKNPRIKPNPIPPKTINEVIGLRQEGLTNEVIIKMLKLQRQRKAYDNLIKKLIADGKIESRERIKP